MRRSVRSRLTGLAGAFVALGALAVPSAAGHVQGSYTPTGDMTVPRGGATAAPLADGRVLVAGGDYYDNSGSTPFFVHLRSAEIYDPATGTFAPTGDMTVSRFHAASAPLPDGRVLIVGGGDANHDSLQSAEIFDPATGTFAPTGDMTVARNAPAAAPLPDGRVLVAGGEYTGSGFREDLASTEIFDPRTGTFTFSGFMTTPRRGAEAAPVPGGRVLIVGGNFDHVSAAEIFDPATGKFVRTGGTANGPAYTAAAPLPDGRVLLPGTGDFGLSGQIFDSVTATFVPTDNMTTGREDAAAATLSDGRVLIAGTSPNNLGLAPVDNTRSAELFTPGFFYRLVGRKLTVSVAAAGTLTVAGSTSRPSLKPKTRKGGPGTISFKLNPAGKAKRRLARTGKAKVLARLAFVPEQVKGNCVTEVSPCFTSEYAINMTRTLTLKSKKRR